MSEHTLRTPVIAGNWKMHKAPSEATSFMKAFLPLLDAGHSGTIALLPSALSLSTCAAALSGRADVALGVQNIHWEKSGAFTGEISGAMAAAAGARIVLVGHSERRHVFGETDDETRRKVRAALDSDLIVVLCVGETLDERKDGRLQEVILRQLSAGLGDVLPEELLRVVIAYEPVWAIGTGVNATPDDASLAHAILRAALRELGPQGENVPILYGGSVKPDNSGELLAAPGVDGLLVGGASLDPEGFAAICRSA